MAAHPHVTVVDYGVGNLLSVCRALEASGGVVALESEPAAIARADRLILPGVGAFGDCMVELQRRELVEPLTAYAASGRPLLGICVGMQMLLEIGEEFGFHAGLGLIGGRVEAIPAITTGGRPHKIPHIGWSALRRPREGAGWGNSILANVEPGQAVYFVHSFMARPAVAADRLADCDYDGHRICAALQRDNLSGCQFHPEKSGPVGLSILARFLAS